MSDDIAIRPFSTQADYAACVALQYETWGHDFKDACARQAARHSLDAATRGLVSACRLVARRKAPRPTSQRTAASIRVKIFWPYSRMLASRSRCLAGL